jgi:CRP/FNR family transcriptional regulator, polysaccharide utilization system transcription regulator
MLYKNPHIEQCLEGHILFNRLNDKDKDVLHQHQTHAHYSKGEVLLKEGEMPRGMICLSSGKVKVVKEGVGGREQILRMVKPNGFIGYLTVFADSPFNASAIAIEDSTVCIFEKDSFLRVVRRNSDLALGLMKAMSEELGFSNNRTVSLTQKHIRGRLAESILVLKDTYGYEPDGKTLRVYLSREDIANFSNMTTSNAIRTLSNLASEEVIALEGRKIMILDSPKLEKISELG